MSTSNKIQVDAKLLRAACGTAVAVSVLLLGNYGSSRKVKTVVRIWRSTKQWHTDRNKALRSCEGTLAWIRKQIAECGFWKELMGIMALLEDSEALGYCEFLQDLEEDDIDDEEDAANIDGQRVWGLRFARERRLLWLTDCWPHSCAKVLGDAMAQEDTIKLFNQDRKIWQDFLAFEKPCAKDREIQERQ